MQEIAKLKGSFTLFGLFMPAEAPLMDTADPGTWDLVVSAPWLERGRLKACRELVRLLVKFMGRDAVSRLSTVEIVAGNDSRVLFLLRSLPVEDGELHIQGKELLGLQIEKAVIFRAWRHDRRGADKSAPSPVNDVGFVPAAGRQH
jgi:hypothetical protein